MARLRRIPIIDLPPQSDASRLGSCLLVVREGNTGPTRIGLADHPARRLSSLQAGNPRLLNIGAVFAGGLDELTALHRLILAKFKSVAMVGDWIDANEADVIRAIEQSAEIAP